METKATVRWKQMQQLDGNKSNSQMETNATVRCKQIQESDTDNYIVQQEKTTCHRLTQTDNHIFHTGTWPVLILLIL